MDFALQRTGVGPDVPPNNNTRPLTVCTTATTFEKKNLQSTETLSGGLSHPLRLVAHLQ